jgi:uncharacterized protein YndB with AHSA1/START domain
MADIFHKVAVRASTGDTYRALTQRQGLARWWTTDTKGEPKVDSLLRFGFAEGKWVVEMRVAELDENKRVAWKCVAGPAEWIGTDLTFDLAEEDGRTVVRFGHRNWKEVVDFMGHCSAKWAYFLLSLKAYLESGAGTPHPHDLNL